MKEEGHGRDESVGLVTALNVSLQWTSLNLSIKEA